MMTDATADHPSESSTPVHLAIALNGTGWHPASWRDPRAHPAEIFDIGYWAELVRLAESGDIDFVTLDDAFGMQSAQLHRPDERTDQVRGYLDAVLTLAAIAPITTSIGLIPTVNVTHSEPFHVSTRIASLDWASAGRAGLRPQITFRAADSRNFGLIATPELTEDDITDPVKISIRLSGLFDDAARHLASVRDLWDSWDEDPVIQDATTYRYIDRSRLHTLPPHGSAPRPRGPSITPRPPQGQPVVVALAHAPIPYRLAAREADIVFTTPHSDSDVKTVRTSIETIAHHQRPAHYSPIRIFADLTVLVEDTGSSNERRRSLDARLTTAWTSDSRIVTGTVHDLADLIESWHALGIDGFRLRPAVLPTDLYRISRDLVPILHDRNLRPRPSSHDTLRHRLGLPVPESRLRGLSQRT